MSDLAMRVFKAFKVGPDEMIMQGSFISMCNKWNVEFAEMEKSMNEAVQAGYAREGKRGTFFLTQAGYKKINS